MSATIEQSGLVTSGHPVQWVAPGVVKDAGPASNGTLTGVGVQNSGIGFQQNSGPINLSYASISFGFESGIPTIAVGGSSDVNSLNFNINGNITSIASLSSFVGFTNVLAYGAGIGGDDAAAIQSALASNRVILIPPGTYIFKSQQIPPSPVTNENTPCVMLVGLQNCYIFAYGATFLIDNSISGPNTSYENCGSNHFSFFNNCKNVGIFGGTFVGNRTGLPSGTANSGIAWSSVTGMIIRDVLMTGDFSGAGEVLTGVYAFDSEIDNATVVNGTTAINLAHCQNLLIKNPKLFAGTGGKNVGISMFYDTTTVNANVVTGYNGGARFLNNSIGNNIRVEGGIIEGFITGELIDGVQGHVTDGTVIRNGVTTTNGGTAIVINNGSSGASLGHPTQDVKVSNCSLYNCGYNGSGVGGGIIIATNNITGLTGIKINNNEIYDNYGSGIIGATEADIGVVNITENDFNTHNNSGVQTSAININLENNVGDHSLFTNNAGYNPRGIADNQDIPSGTGTSHVVINNFPFPCTVYINNTGSSQCVPLYLRAGQSSGDNIFPNGLQNGTFCTVNLFPGDGIYFNGVVATSWEWFGQ